MLDLKKISSVELTKEYINRINSVDKKLNSYITVCEDEAIKTAKLAQKMIDSGVSGVLTGIPLSVKDNICTKNIATTCASKMLENFIPDYDAEVVTKIKNQNGVILGKTNMDEFAMGSTSASSYFGRVKNPYNEKCTSGGSSGGAAAAVSAKLCVASIASDTGGSIRQPAAFCGVTGIKPTYSTVSRRGLVAFAPSLDQIGVIAGSAVDTGYVLDVISGKDNGDMTSGYNEKSFISQCGKSIKGMKIGIVAEFFSDSTDDEVKKAVLDAARFYESCGCELISCSLPSLKYAVSAYYIISSAEAASNLERFDGIRYGYRFSDGESYEEIITKSRSEGFGEEVKRRIMLGNYVLSSRYYDKYYKKALQVREKLKFEYSEILKECNFILTPTAPFAADAGLIDANPVETYLSDVCTVSANIAGLPAISTTCGYNSKGMPIGMSLTGRAFDEKTIIGAADVFQRNFERREAIL